MKRKLCAILSMIMTTAVLLSTNVMAADSVTIPMQMQPGTILHYDDNLNATIEQGGYAISATGGSIQESKKQLILANIPEGASQEEIDQIELENQIATVAYNMYIAGDYTKAPDFVASPGIKVVYNEITGQIDNIYYPDDNDPSGYSIHNAPEIQPQQTIGINASAAIMPAAAANVQWTWGTNNVLTYQAVDDSYLGTGRATYYIGTTGNRPNTLQNYDCATKMDYDYSKKGDQDVSIRNLDTNQVYIFHQADVGGLPDAIIDIWGLTNLHTLAGSNNALSAGNVRYYHKRFSDQSIPS